MLIFGSFVKAEVVSVGRSPLMVGNPDLAGKPDVVAGLDALWSDVPLWSAIGRMLAGFHAAGCDHPDLTAHNILVDPGHRPFLVDFDNARLRAPGPWRDAGIERLKRSLNKVSLETGTSFDEVAWQALLTAYAGRSA